MESTNIFDFIKNHIYVDQTNIVYDFIIPEQCIHIPDIESNEYFEWLLISRGLASVLKEIGQEVIMCRYGNWWGRKRTRTDRKFLEDDLVIKHIYEKNII